VADILQTAVCCHTNDHRHIFKVETADKKQAALADAERIGRDILKKDISVDVLKMDMKFFEEKKDNVRAEKIVRSVVTLANELGMPVIAEGVETADDVEMLRRVGCQIVQGYYFSKPLSVLEYEQFISQYENCDLSRIIDKVKANI
jgi:predicted signal transduction protein with EAL and GGDEF domain